MEEVGKGLYEKCVKIKMWKSIPYHIVYKLYNLPNQNWPKKLQEHPKWAFNNCTSMSFCCRITECARCQKESVCVCVWEIEREREREWESERVREREREREGERERERERLWMGWPFNVPPVFCQLLFYPIFIQSLKPFIHLGILNILHQRGIWGTDWVGFTDLKLPNIFQSK
jgi:hypothetical protein